jgi:deazaflavin-dependent oxidoreductase (nitroreductase family)
MRRSILVAVVSIATALTATIAAFLVAWRRDPRLGSGFVNRAIDPLLVERGVSGAGRSEIGTIEHIGRKSGVRRLTPVHPVATEDGFRIIVPLGERSEWAQNVLAAGHCRVQLHDVVHELDEPTLSEPARTPGLSRISRWLSSWLGFRYLLLHELASAPGSLLEPSEQPTAAPLPTPASRPPEPAAAAA